MSRIYASGFGLGGEHEEPCSKRPPEREDESMSIRVKVTLWLVCGAAVAGIFVAVLKSDHSEREAWRRDWIRRIELCESQGGIPRYVVRGRGYDGCDFQKDR